MSLRIGTFEVHEVRDGSFALDGGTMFGVVPRPLWAKVNPPDERNRIELALRCLLVIRGDRRVLIDTGMGDRWSQRQRDIYRLDRSASDLDGGLARAGVAREEITDVVLTHLHFDHAGGAVRMKGDEEVLSFPNATHHVQRRNWAWSHHSTERDRGSFRTDLFRLLERDGTLHLIEGQQELFPGFEVFVSEGHTVGQQLVRVEDEDKVLVFCGDLIPTSAHLLPPWAMAYDLYPLTAMEEKRVLLAQAIEERWILAFDHDPKVAACTVKEVEGEATVDEVISL